MASIRSNSSPVRVGVLLIPPVQLLDTSPVDLLGMLTREYLQACNLPPPLVALGIDVDIHYISAAGPGTLAEATSNCALRVTDSLSDTTVSPGKLDMLIIPGPDPSMIPTDEVKVFIKGHADEGETDLLTVCTGIFAAGHSGILNGKQVTGPRALLGTLKKDFPEADFVEKRWCKDGKLWTSAGITNGQDMLAAYIREHFRKELADLVCAMADVGGRTQEYGNGNLSEKAWWVGLIIRSLWRGKSR